MWPNLQTTFFFLTQKCEVRQAKLVLQHFREVHKMFSPGFGRMTRFPFTKIICTLKNLISLSVKQGRGISFNSRGFGWICKSSPLNLKVTSPSQVHECLGFESTWTSFGTTGALWPEALLPVVIGTHGAFRSHTESTSTRS